MTHPPQRSLNERQPLWGRRCTLWLAATMLCLAAVPIADAEDNKRRSRRSTRSKTEAEQTVPQDYRSRHFIIHTDLSKDEAKDLLNRLETMLRLISRYWGAPCRKTIECYVVKDLKKWPANSLHPDGLRSVSTGGGVTLSQSKKLPYNEKIVDANAVVYAVSQRGVPLHEAVHAYCALTFGRTGPPWYSEGMAELGNYWRQNDSSVLLEPVVLRYLQRAEIMSLNEIVNGAQTTGDSWQNYAWRWALCHLLSHNPNYAPRFRPLGLGLLNGQDVSFEQVYGAMAPEITFEYKFFIEHLDQGLRADLIHIDWKKKFRKRSSITRATLRANHGWQPTGLTVEAEQPYDFSAAGLWQLTKDGPYLDADGNEVKPVEPSSDDAAQPTVTAKPGRAAEIRTRDGKEYRPGELVGVVMTFDEKQGYALSKPFTMGRYGTFVAPAEGNLFVRCGDQWNKLDDNSGTMTVQVKSHSDTQPLREPPPEVAPQPKPSRRRPPVKSRATSKRETGDE